MELLKVIFTMSGREFLALYVAWFVILYVALWVLRKGGADSPRVTMAVLCLFEGFGLIRIIWGILHGKEHWVLLIFMMALGGVLFLVRSTSSGNSGGPGCGGGGCGGSGGSCGNASCSSGSSCSGGGSSCGGGGGCGGCGGS